MIKLIKNPSIIASSGNKPKIIEEFIGRINTQTEALSIARMKSPEGWEEPGQIPEFDEYTVVLEGKLQVSTRDGEFVVEAGQAVIATAGEWIQYSTPFKNGARYLAVCLPAFGPDLVNRDRTA